MKKIYKALFLLVALVFTTSIFAEDVFNFDHIIYGEIKNDKLVGGHSTNGVTVVKNCSYNGGNNAYYAIVRKCEKGFFSSKCYEKGRSSYHTMFPDSWSETRIKKEIAGAWKDAKYCDNSKSKWCSTTPSGIEVEGYLNPKRTAHPKVNYKNSCAY